MALLTHRLTLASIDQGERLSPLRALRRWRRFRRNLREIATLDDHMLRDIGTNRAELMGYAWRDANDEYVRRGY